jgi:flotillin
VIAITDDVDIGCLQDAEGIHAKMTAQAEGLQKLLTAASPDLVKYYLALETGLFTAMGDKTAKAVQGLQPKINIWNTGDKAGASGDAMSPIRQLFTSLPPMLDAVTGQTDVQLPSWLPHMSKANQPVQQ